MNVIPPRPWRVERGTSGRARENDGMVLTADGYGITGWLPLELAEFIVRLVNAEPEIIAALDYAESYFTAHVFETGVNKAQRALALLRGDAPAPPVTVTVKDTPEMRAAVARLRDMPQQRIVSYPPERPPADPDVVAALEAAEREFDRILAEEGHSFPFTTWADGIGLARDQVRAALAKVRP